MSNRLSTILGVVLVMVFFFGGCQQGTMRDEREMTSEQDPIMISVPSGFATEAFEAAGGQDAWTETKKMGLDCVVTFYKPDGTYYLTQQHYDIYPWSNVIEISGREPSNAYSWRFSKGAMSPLESTGQIDEFPPDLERSCFAQAVLAIATAPASFVEPSAQFNRQDAAVKKQGKWYYPIHKAAERSGETVLYQDRGTLRVELIRVPCSDMNQALMVRGYDYQKIEKEGPLVPARIEIFSTGVAGVIQKRLVKIDCHTMTRSK